MLKILSKTFLVFLLFYPWFPEVFGQPVFPSDLKKPKKYENKKLGAEKSAEKKFKGPRRFIQNTVTHYNWYFNANNKLNEIMEQAKLSHKDDFATLLPFYNYSLEKTSADKTELDSVIYKSNAGILTHDLRNAWIDNLYMLLGKAYYFRNDLDSAYLTFQYINYAFSPKEEDGYDKPIGSNANEESNALSVSTKENNSLIKRALSTPPSRNESFIWQIKTYLAKDEMAEAASLIETLKNDSLFPDRLSADLSEMQALWFYKQKMYDSAAIFLEKALGNAANRQETSRWEYLIAQLYELSKKPGNAIDFYERAIKHTLDPVLEVYAMLNAIKQNTTDSIAIKKNLEQLRKMGRKDRYSKYRDIVYYTAAQIELERNNIPGAKAMLLKSTAASSDNLNPAQRTRSFLLLGDLSFQEKNYSEAKRFYDSVNNNDPGITDVMTFEKRKEILGRIVLQSNIISRQDSLQRLAAMPEAERTALLKKMVRQLRKKQGLKEEETVNAAIGLNSANNDKDVPDLFNSNEKGDWYFNNPSLKSKGFTSFKSTWGNRPNADNWRRQSSINQANTAARELQANMNIPGGAEDTSNGGAGEISVQSLLKNIPVTPEQLETSQDSVGNALLDMGIIYVDHLEEYSSAISTLEKFVEKHSYSSRMPEALYYLYYSYKKTGNDAKAIAVQHELDQKYDGNRYQQQIQNAVTGNAEKAKTKMTKDYEKVYNLFIEGSFEQALEEKKINDSLYGSSYWTPQLLYIESVYYLQTRQDDKARTVLQSIIDLYPDEPMSAKSKNILEVLGRRTEIEEYLTNLKIERKEDTIIIANAAKSRPEQIGTPMIQDSTTIQPLKKHVIIAPPPVAKNDSVKAELPTAFTFNVEAPHSVAIVLSKVDPVYVNESRNAFNRYNQEKYYNKTITINNVSVNDTLKLVVMSGFENAATALEYMQKTQPVARTQIIPWLPADKYSFLIISDYNIEVLKNNQDINAYRKFHERYFPK